VRHLLVALALGAAVAGSVVGTAHAQKLETIKHRVERGDTLELLAAEYYGDRRYAVFIMTANKMTHPEPLRPGRRIRIPIQREITASVGDTLGGLAEQHLGDPRRATFLAEFNNLEADASIAAGQTVVIPFHVTHRAAARETIGSIAAAYFGDSGKAGMLRNYNFLEEPALEKGESLVVPIYNVRVRRSKLPAPDAESQQREARLREMEEKAVAALPRARAAWREGDYQGVKRLLVDLDLDYLPAKQVPAVGMLLGRAYIAFHDTDSATAVFQDVLRRAPDTSMDEYTYSPVERKTWIGAGGKVAAGRSE